MGVNTGLYFRNDALWRGRAMAHFAEIRGVLYELGFWSAAMYLAVAASKWFADGPILIGAVVCIRMLIGYLEERQAQRRIDGDIRHCIDQGLMGSSERS
jgi:hypothetical protein